MEEPVQVCKRTQRAKTEGGESEWTQLWTLAAAKGMDPVWFGCWSGHQGGGRDKTWPIGRPTQVNKKVNHARVSEWDEY